MSSSEKQRVRFTAPASIVERADAVADQLDISRTQLIIDALTDKLREIAVDEEFKRRVRNSYYTDRIEFADLETLLGTEEAIRSKLLKDTLDRDPAVPELSADFPEDEEFYRNTASE